MFGLVSQRRFNTLEKEYEELKRKIHALEQLSIVNSSLRQEVATLQSQLAEVKKQIREQIEANLFFISAKIQKKLLDGEPKENVQDFRSQQMALQAQLAQMQQPSPSSSFLQGLGLGGFFGRF